MRFFLTIFVASLFLRQLNGTIPPGIYTPDYFQKRAFVKSLQPKDNKVGCVRIPDAEDFDINFKDEMDIPP